MREFVSQPITDPLAVANVLRRYAEAEGFREVVLASFDNLRQDYNAGKPFEFGGIALTPMDIKAMVERQAHELIKRARGFDRVMLVWKAESARLYGDALACAVRGHGGLAVTTGYVSTKWRRTAVADVIGGEFPRPNPCDFVVACDLMSGSGATMRAIFDWMTARGIPPNALSILVNAVDYAKSARLPELLEPCYKWHSLDWLIGYNSDCPSRGVSIGRELPFLGFLRPAGTGIRAALRDTLRRGEE